MKKFTLIAQKRQIVGKKVKNLRKQQLLPANIFGKNIKSQSIQMPVLEFAGVYKRAHETNLVEIDVDGQKHLSLIQNVQIHPVTGNFIHADFFQVDLKEKVKTKVPVEFIGSSLAVEQKLGLVLKLADEIEIEALPGDLPEKLILDISQLKALGDVLRAGDIKLPKGVVLLIKPETEMVKIGELLTKEAEKLKAEEAEAKAQQVAQAAVAAAPVAPSETTKTEAPVTTAPGKKEAPVKT